MLARALQSLSCRPQRGATGEHQEREKGTIMEGPAQIIWSGPRVLPPTASKAAPQVSPAETFGTADIIWSGPRVTAAPEKVAAAAGSGVNTGPGADSPPEDEFMPFGEDGLTFLDFLDIINPLQHIPIISTIYRHLTGDELSPAARVAGGALYGGIIGAAVSIANVIVEYASGKDMGEHALSLFVDEEAAETLTADTDALLKDVDLKAAPEIIWNGPRVAAADFIGAPDIAWNAPRLAPQTQAALIPLQAPERAPGRSPGQIPGADALPLTTPVSARDPGQPAAADETADVFSAVRYPADTRRADEVSALPSAPGAPGANDVWFSATVVTALDKYRQGAELTRRPQAPALNIAQ
jgi:hypothetical protein